MNISQSTFSFNTVFRELLNMVSFITQAMVALIIAGPALAQVKAPPNRFASEIPKAEAVALSQIVEDEVVGAPAARKGGSDSPAYTLYSAALPIPPVAHVKQFVNPMSLNCSSSTDALQEGD
jgi:bilirubin oxidase